MTTLCIYHNDADGCASAAVVRHAIGEDAIMHEISYGEPTPWKKIAKVKQVIIVDFSLPLQDMRRIASERMLTWIDHHKSAMEEVNDEAREWAGLRDLSEAACVLTWKYFFPHKPVPRALILIGDRDIWRQEEPDAGAFNEGLQQEQTQPNNDQLWKPLLSDSLSAVDSLISKGQPLLDSRLLAMRRFVSRYGFPVIFEGMRTLAVNRRGDADLGQHIRDLGYDIGYCYLEGSQGGKIVTFVTLFSNNVDVSEIAKKYGGGGHEGAAGFSFVRNASPFPDGSITG
jgi:oligoribonuclease NrnB/cAMP/cGMP phosphodiesterase (DHH superfamily)